MKKEEYQAWLSSPLTKMAFKLWNDYVREINDELIEGKRISDNEHITVVNYSSIIGYNKMFRELQTFEWEQLVGRAQDIVQEEPDNYSMEKKDEYQEKDGPAAE